MRKIGLFCGTFNPIHSGHRLIAECARDQCALDKVIFITSSSPPHRQDQDLLDARARHDMVLAAIADNPNFEASTVEIDRDGLSYTIETVEHFRKLYPDSKIYLIIGGDNVRHLKEWHRSDDLFEKCHFLVAPRLVSSTIGLDVSEVRMVVDKECSEWRGARMNVIDFPGIAISASYIRNRIREKQSVLYMVPTAVNNILVAKGYYRSETV